MVNLDALRGILRVGSRSLGPPCGPLHLGKHQGSIVSSRSPRGSYRGHDKAVVEVVAKRPGKEKPEFPSAKGKEPIEPTKEATVATTQWLKSMRKLCHTPIIDKDEGYHALRMTDLPSLDPDAPMAPHWSMLKNWSKVWLDRASLTEYERGILLPHLASDLYALSSEVISMMDNKMVGIRKKIEELKVGSKPEVIMAAKQCITDFQAKARQLSSELEEATRQQEASEMELNESCFLLGDAQ
ncbi:hypothetical protein BHE74_00020961 [Ensete ventricosum]|uniref:Uncharacterized protein n=1 Tax=Ensete ventricosum TaxID=4639 RepID=A0A444D9D4_ENSVE|nr:hypothetical protein GW17_00042735 [Ensete ventricosum]RWW71297.1 hypothetical protein BHE74_00020961 [Ensete ventricosum]RZR74760.1 hypothetical protein BHM03_00042703 [Ensete ventricosum]